MSEQKPRVFLPGDDIPYGVFYTDGESVYLHDEPDGLRNGNSCLAYVEVFMPDVRAEADRARAERGLD